MNQLPVDTTPGPRSRPVYAAGALAVIAVGLWCRSETAGLPWPVAKYLGDALWGLVLFLGIGFLLPRLPTGSAAGLAAAFAVAVEVSQLYHAPWFDAVRGTRPGGLVLGTPAATFAWADIAAYLAGVAAGASAERVFSGRGSGPGAGADHPNDPRAES
ncbi:MAG: hypothetical protein JWO38_4412 [Gemmataceae bacterium]|nr:hypothetical protein [Gemmataceae bacterium]